ncbi:GumC family protein [Aerosakkonemataceae cyanobacterium BLCC-F154]|uniref:GumC family protein n=1 Tax=Floridaenema fluviatile BLCC-F154 TaxID=3153640 RepID=A0ABV4YH90_9CYAN
MVDVNANNWNTTAETEPGYGQLLAILIRRRYWLLSVFSVVLAITTVITLTTKPTYKSSMQLLVEPNYQGKQEGTKNAENEFADSNVEIDYATQLNLMRSSQLIQKAVNLLRPQYPKIKVKDLKDSLVVNQLEEDKVNTKIFEVTYIDNDPIKTQNVLETIKRVYQDYNREQQQLRLTRGLAFIDTQLPSMRENTARTEAALDKFRKNQNFIEPELQARALIESLKDVQYELRTARAQYQEAQARFQILQQQVKRSPQDAVVSSRLSESNRYQTLLNEIQKIDLELAKERQRFTDDNPYIQNLLEQRRRQLALLQKEQQTVQGNNILNSNVPNTNLMQQGQLGKLDVNLSQKLLEEQTNVQGWQAKVQTLTQKAQEIQAQLQRFPGMLSEYNRLEPEVKLNRETLEQLLKARQELSLEIARGGFDWQLVEEPQLGLKIGPSIKRNLLLGAVVGLMLGGIVAFIREMIDDAVHTSDELKKQVDLPLLGIIPQLTPQIRTEPIIHLPFRQQPILASSTIELINWQPFRESLDLIYQNIQLVNSAGSLKSLVITSALAGEGKSAIALGLAISAARLHQRVLLIDADLRRPSLHKELNLPNDRGLSTLLTSDVSLRDETNIQISRQYNNISILTAGPTPLDPAQLLSSQRMRELMANFEQTYDLVLLDAPPVLGIVDSILTASFCNGVVLVGRIGRVTRSELNQATNMLNKLNVIGVVANGAEVFSNGYGSYPQQNQELLQPRSRG